jgi:Reverse transcriptase (RNA-dependent DNA polymerase)/Endonuclease/Exonuclease/phosphatase family
MTLTTTENLIYSIDTQANRFLHASKQSLTSKDFCLLTEIITEWHSASSLVELFHQWVPHRKSSSSLSYAYLHILCFNVRGFNPRWGEVCLLVEKHSFDILVLGEVGNVDFSLIGAALSNYKTFYQAGENAHGGVLVLIKNGLSATRVSCEVPNVCVIDLLLEETTRLIALYAPASKSWRWSDLTPFISKQCMVMGDFNIDMETDGDEAEKLLEWMDHCSLGQVAPDSNTSLRSERTIDYALAVGVDLTIQAHDDETTSDHKPLSCTLGYERIGDNTCSRTSWVVFTLFLSYVADFWEREWAGGSYDTAYEKFNSFLALLVARCKHYFPQKRARPSIPPELKTLLAQSRAISFKAKRKGDVMLKQEARRLRNCARFELKRFQQMQLTKQLKERHSANDTATIFWSKTKRHFRSVSSSLRGMVLPDGNITKDPQIMANVAAEYYEKLFEAPVVVRPHPYVDAPPTNWDNDSVIIPSVTYPEVLSVLRTRKKNHSLDIHDLSPFILDKIPRNYWHLLVQLYNHSFMNSVIPKKFKEVRMVLLAKKDPICTPDQTRPISLLDSFLKVQERLFLNRFLQILLDRGILPDNQSGFRAGYRLQTRVLLLIEQISSYMSNSSPVATVFVDFKSAFDQLWFEGCLGKLGKLGIPRAYINWIREWLNGRQAVIEIQGKRSNWFPIQRGGPQGSSLTPTLFIT